MILVRLLAQYKLIRQIAASIGAIAALLAAYWWIFETNIGWALIVTGVAVMLISVAGYAHNKVIKTRAMLKKAPREHRGHQDEPGSWQCSCGRYNGSYRSVCLGCGKKRPGLADY